MAESSPTFTIRRGSVHEAAVVTEHRRRMFHEMGHTDAAQLDDMAAHFDPWVRKRLETGEYLAWFAIAPKGYSGAGYSGAGSIAAGLGVWLMDWPPHMVAPGACRGNILNVYTRPDCRRQGLARRLMETALDWCRSNGIVVVILHSSDAGRPLYEAMGFRPTNEMRLEPPHSGASRFFGHNF